MEFLEATDPEWSRMWEDVCAQSINGGDPLCLFEGKVWEYMGSSLDYHYLRHAKHPTTGRSEHVYVERRRALVNWG